METSSLQKFLDAGVQFTEMTRKQAESLVKSLVQSGELRRKDAEKTVQELVERGKETSDKLNARIEAEVNKQISAARARFDELEDRVESLAEQMKSMASSDGGTTSSAKKKAPAKKAPAKKAPAKKAVGSSGVRKVSSTRTS